MKRWLALAVQPQRLGGTAVVDAVKSGCLKQDVARSFVHFRFCAAHHAGNGDRACPVCNEKHRTIEFPLLSVQGLNLLARVRSADDDGGGFLADARRPGREQIIIERVERLAQLQHDIVGYVDDVVDRTHSGLRQTFLHPGRRSADLDIADNRAGKAVTVLGVVDLGAEVG